MDFKIGDKIIAIRDFTVSGVTFKKGSKGIAKIIGNGTAGVEWEHYDRRFHTCSSTCKKGYGFYIYTDRDLIRVINKKGNMYGF